LSRAQRWPRAHTAHVATSPDNLFNIKSTTQDVYDTMAKGVVTSAMEGIHGEG
jgi:hypothetical protein